MKSKYNTVLTVLLILMIVVILVIGTIAAIRVYKEYVDKKENSKAIADLQNSFINQTNATDNNNETDNILTEPVDENLTSTNTDEQQGTSKNNVQLYKNYPKVGYIKIDKTGIEYPILSDASPGALEVGVSVMYPTNPNINQPGITVIIGHNYRNGKLFSNNKKLAIGDKIKITDLTGKTLTYNIIEIFQTSPSDTEYITRERGNNIDIALSTCTDDGKDRLVILARAQ